MQETALTQHQEPLTLLPGGRSRITRNRGKCGGAFWSQARPTPTTSRVVLFYLGFPVLAAAFLQESKRPKGQIHIRAVTTRFFHGTQVAGWFGSFGFCGVICAIESQQSVDGCKIRFSHQPSKTRKNVIPKRNCQHTLWFQPWFHFAFVWMSQPFTVWNQSCSGLLRLTR